MTEQKVKQEIWNNNVLGFSKINDWHKTTDSRKLKEYKQGKY